MKVLVLDNYDSFVYNLVYLLKELGAEVDVFRNDKISLEEVGKYDNILLSPGPGIPSEAGIMMDLLKEYKSTKKNSRCLPGSSSDCGGFWLSTKQYGRSFTRRNDGMRGDRSLGTLVLRNPSSLRSMPLPLVDGDSIHDAKRPKSDSARWQRFCLSGGACEIRCARGAIPSGGVFNATWKANDSKLDEIIAWKIY